jgi:arylsulfatase A
MNRIQGALIAGTLVSIRSERADAQQRAAVPNVVLIQADDLGYGDLSSYGQANFQTPALDRLARKGIRHTQYYAGSTVCGPSRAALMTGLHTRGERRRSHV